MYNSRLKFRVWDKLEKRYLKITPLSKHHYVLDLEGKFHNLQNGSGGDEYVVEQFTGLIDKNGEEIYEGDVVKLKWICNLLQQPENEIIGSVDCCQGVYRIKKYNMLGNYTDGNIEVVGNINENPELVENM